MTMLNKVPLKSKVVASDAPKPDLEKRLTMDIKNKEVEKAQPL